MVTWGAHAPGGTVGARTCGLADNNLDPDVPRVRTTSFFGLFFEKNTPCHHQAWLMITSFVIVLGAGLLDRERAEGAFM